MRRDIVPVSRKAKYSLPSAMIIQRYPAAPNVGGRSLFGAIFLSLRIGPRDRGLTVLVVTFPAFWVFVDGKFSSRSHVADVTDSTKLYDTLGDDDANRIISKVLDLM
jgi:hypothetical protein